MANHTEENLRKIESPTVDNVDYWRVTVDNVTGKTKEKFPPICWDTKFRQ